MKQAEIVITNNKTLHNGYIQLTADQELIDGVLQLLRIDKLVAPYNTVTIIIRPANGP